MKNFFKIFVFFLSLQILWAEEFEGKVVSVMDGDTIRVLVGSKQVKVRLFGIDAPERSQAYGKKAEQELKSLIWKKKVRVVVKDTDQYGRTVGLVFLGDLEINLEMVKKGFAWVYREFNMEKKYLEAEEVARKSEIGIWKDKNPTPPWLFRKNEKFLRNNI
ncbi:MAG: thermonuclease family protein [Leptospiraceae bacterium]|nr:thermonuclease family protein [Leptospiraceae bacterium]